MSLPQRLAELIGKDEPKPETLTDKAAAVENGFKRRARNQLRRQQKEALPALSHSVLADMLAIAGQKRYKHYRYCGEHYEEQCTCGMYAENARIDRIKAKLTAYCIGDKT